MPAPLGSSARSRSERTASCRDRLVDGGGRPGDRDRDPVARQALGDRLRIVEGCRNVERERIRRRCAPAELAFEAVAPEQSPAEDPVAPDGEIVPPLLQRLRDMDSALAQWIRGFVARAIELLAVRDGGSPRRPKAAVEDAAQARSFLALLDTPDLPADDRLVRVHGCFSSGSDSHDI